MKTFFLYCLIFLGIFLPSSINSIYIGVTYNIVSFIFAILILFISMRRLNPIKGLLVIFILLFLIINTLLTTSTQFQPGTLLTILPLLFFFSIDLKHIDMRLLMTFLNCLSIALFLLGAGVILSIPAVDSFLGQYYVGSFADLYNYMLGANSPVGPFGSHSIAAFIYFLFFIIYYISWLHFRKVQYLIFSILFLVLIFALKSFSALFFIIFAFLTILNTKFLLHKIDISFIFFNIVITVTLYTLLSGFIDIPALLAGNESNGFLARYGKNGVLTYDIHYLKDNLFMGDGIGYNDNLHYTDSGYIRALLTYGITGAIIFYIVFARVILKKNYTYIFIIFFACLFFEIGYDIFFYNRYIFILILISLFIENINFSIRNIEK